MNDFFREYYLWFKAFHLIAIISWMAGMLYLPRLFVYHADTAPGSDADEKFIIMEKRLLRIIMNPAMVVTLVLGFLLIKSVGAEGLGKWFHLKMLFVIGLLACHGLMAKWRKDFEKGKNSKEVGFFRIFNEIPTLLMIAIVILAVVKPFW